MTGPVGAEGSDVESPPLPLPDTGCFGPVVGPLPLPPGGGGGGGGPPSPLLTACGEGTKRTPPPPGSGCDAPPPESPSVTNGGRGVDWALPPKGEGGTEFDLEGSGGGGGGIALDLLG